VLTSRELRGRLEALSAAKGLLTEGQKLIMIQVLEFLICSLKQIRFFKTNL
jgi:hypothetical protein